MKKKLGEIMNQEKRIVLEKRALNVSMLGVVFFIAVEGFMALRTSSQSILMDAVYGAADFVTIMISIKLIPLLYKPTSEKHPFGFAQMEAMFITIKGAMLTAVTVGLVLNNIQIILKGGNQIEFSDVAVFEFVAAICCGIILFFMIRLNRKVDSNIVKVEIQAWIIDCVASVGLTIAFILPSVIHTEWMESFSPYLDQVVAIILSALILPMPIKVALSGLRDLFLWAPDEETIDVVKEITEKTLSSYPMKQTVYDIVKTGRKLWIGIYFNSEDDMVSVSLIKKVRLELESALKEEFPDLYVELIPEFE